MRQIDTRSLNSAEVITLAAEFASWANNGHVTFEKTKCGTGRTLVRAGREFELLSRAVALENLGLVQQHLASLLEILGVGKDARLEIVATQPRYEDEARVIAGNLRALNTRASELLQQQARRRQQSSANL